MGQQIHIGFLGEQRSGKSRAIKLLGEQYCPGVVAHFSFSQPLRQILEIAGLPFSRLNTSPLAELLDKLGGPGTVSRMTTNRAKKSELPLVFLDGIRWPSDVVELRKFPVNYLVYITADPKVRHQRAQLDPEKPDEADISLQEFIRREKELPTEQFIAELGSQADHIIVHNDMDKDFSTLRDKVANLGRFLQTLRQ